MPLTGVPLGVRRGRRRTARRWSSRSTTTRRPARRPASTRPTSSSRRSSRAGHPLRRRVPLARRRPGRPDPLRPHPGRRPARRLQPAAVRLERRQRRRHAGDRRLRLHRHSTRAHAAGYYRGRAATARRTTCTPTPTRCGRRRRRSDRARRRRCSPTCDPGEASAGQPGDRRRRADGQHPRALGLGRRHRRLPCAPERARRTTTEAHGQVVADNVVVLVVDYQPSAVDRRSPEAQTRRRRARSYVFSDGKVRRRARGSAPIGIDPFGSVDADGATDRAARRAAPGSSWPTTPTTTPSTGVGLTR